MLGNLNIRAYSVAFRLAMLEALQYPARMFAMVSTAGIRMLFIFIVYSYVFATIGTSRPGVTLVTVLASLALYQVLLTISFRKVFYRILRDIQRGDVEVALTRPQSYIWRLISEHIGFGCLNIIPASILAVVLVSLFSDVSSLPVTGPLVLWGIVLAILGTTLSACIFICASLPALWINDAEPFIMIIDKAVMLLGGAYLPVALMPGWMATIALYSPFGAVMFVTHIFNTNFIAHAPYLVLAQLFWILVIGLLAWHLFQRGVKKISINGG